MLRCKAVHRHRPRVIRQVLSIFHVPRVEGSSRQLAGGACVALPKALNMTSSQSRPRTPGATPSEAHSKSAQLGQSPAHWISCLPDDGALRVFYTSQIRLSRRLLRPMAHLAEGAQQHRGGQASNEAPCSHAHSSKRQRLDQPMPGSSESRYESQDC
jgi:hypothetical protein